MRSGQPEGCLGDRAAGLRRRSGALRPESKKAVEAQQQVSHLGLEREQQYCDSGDRACLKDPARNDQVEVPGQKGAGIKSHDRECGPERPCLAGQAQQKVEEQCDRDKVDDVPPAQDAPHGDGSMITRGARREWGERTAAFACVLEQSVQLMTSRDTWRNFRPWQTLCRPPHDMLHRRFWTPRLFYAFRLCNSTERYLIAARACRGRIYNRRRVWRARRG